MLSSLIFLLISRMLVFLLILRTLSDLWILLGFPCLFETLLNITFSVSKQMAAIFQNTLTFLGWRSNHFIFVVHQQNFHYEFLICSQYFQWDLCIQQVQLRYFHITPNMFFLFVCRQVYFCW